MTKQQFDKANEIIEKIKELKVTEQRILEKLDFLATPSFIENFLDKTFWFHLHKKIEELIKKEVKERVKELEKEFEKL